MGRDREGNGHCAPGIDIVIAVVMGLPAPNAGVPPSPQDDPLGHGSLGIRGCSGIVRGSDWRGGSKKLEHLGGRRGGFKLVWFDNVPYSGGNTDGCIGDVDFTSFIDPDG